MNVITKEKKLKLLSRLYWDLNIKPDVLYGALYERDFDTDDIDMTSIYTRLLQTYDWYTLLKLVPMDRLHELLNDSVINRLYPEELKKRFLYVREVLSK